MKKNRRRENKKGGTCHICNNGIREEMQYAAMQIGENRFVIMDAEEVQLLNDYFDNDRKNRKQPAYEIVQPEEETEPVIAYGVLIPQYDSEEKNWNEELAKYKNYAFATLEEEKIYASAYSDFKLFEEEIIYQSYIPVALLLDTSMDFSKKKEFGFGHTTFLLYKDMMFLDNVINRDFLFCIGGIEKLAPGINKENWRNSIKEERLFRIARRLF